MGKGAAPAVRRGATVSERSESTLPDRDARAKVAHQMRQKRYARNSASRSILGPRKQRVALEPHWRCQERG